MWLWLGAAQAADTFDSSALLGMGRVGVASADENAALTLNPGLLALESRYDFQGLFRYGPDGATMWGGSAVDGRTSPKISGGLSYCGDVAEPPLRTSELPGWKEPGVVVPNQKRHHDFSLGLGVPFAERQLSVGLGANLGYFQHDRQGSGWLFDVYAGVGARPARRVTLGLALRNPLPLGVEDRPTEVAAGVRLDPRRWPALEVDAVWLPSSDDAVPLTLAAGTQAALDAVRLRAGWRRDGWTGVHAVTAGIGVAGPGAALEYAALVPLADDTDLAATVHQVSLRFAAPEPIPEP